ncbi:MAG: 16S rRNA (adenine(1518)-N(6)/adenine(1519)-N(6))-dimethyltransferase RsmA [Candidatus Omnitrophota bacterium]
MNKKEARFFKERYDFYPRKRLGQSFLVDQNNIERIIASCNLSNKDIVLEIGPGLGALTERIVRVAKRLIAVEIDRNLCDRLREKLGHYKNLTFKCQDFLKFDFKGLKGIKVIANLPFYMSTSIISKLLYKKKSISEIFMTVQKELAERINASGGRKDYGAFSLFVQYHTLPQTLFDIKRTCFRPEPKVDASFMNLKIRKDTQLKPKDEKLVFEIIRKSFTQRRKNIVNALKDLIPKDGLIEALSKSDISLNRRPDSLRLEDFAKLADALSN